MSLKSRLSKINQIAQSPTTRLIHRSSKYRFSYRVDSTRIDKPYQIHFEWLKDASTPTLKCKLCSFDHKEQPHPANECRTVAYQCLGAAKKEARQQGKVLSLCGDYFDAVNLLNFGGRLIKIVNLDGGIVWATVR